ncbi:MAG: cytochrome c biogenesis protein ResB [Bdellovibrionales bacterium]|nr:cytochrome c biogenesis protein ResB [Bdellovibrionales bacterium]
MRWIERIYRILISLRLAVVLLTALTLALIAATFIEAKFDTPTGQYFVYRAFWFYLLLALLGVNILAVALSRWPWKVRHIPFLTAHLGILLLLVGSWVTQRHGVDGIMRVEESQWETLVDIDEPQLVIWTDKETRVFPIRWLPPSVSFRPPTLPYGLAIEEYLSRAEPIFSFRPSDSPKAAPAIQLKFSTKRAMGGMPAMAASQEIWLWEGANEWRQSDIGPAKVILGGTKPDQPGPWIWLNFRSAQEVEFEAVSLRQEKSQGSVKWAGKKTVVDPGWKAVQIEIQDYIPKAFPRTDYVAAKVQYGPKAPPSAIRIRGPKSPGVEQEFLWLGMGDRAVFELGGDRINVTYGPKRVRLPFSLRLNRFNLERYPGSLQPSSFASQVTVDSGAGQRLDHLISMNEPLEWRGFTFYQSSYEDAFPRPTVSIFSVNKDPGRWVKYLGSLILVFGILHFYWDRSRTKKKAPTSRASEAIS